MTSTAPSSAPTTKRRPRRTRTKQFSAAPALVASKLRPNELDLRRGAMAVVCPDCRTWCPITGYAGRYPKLVPHEGFFLEDDRKGGRRSVVRRCQVGSNRRIVLDLTIEHWQRGLVDAGHETSVRRATAVVPRPKAAPAPAVVQMAKDREQPRKPKRRNRAAEWADVLPDFRAVEDVREKLPADTSDDGTNVPREPLRIAV